jgi:cysteine-rich repeat protein
MNATSDCVGHCGDSILASDETCDDGNVYGGDGCSSDCQVETYYACSNAAMPSTCLLNVNITASVRWVKRILTENAAEFGFSLSPYYSAYSTMNFSSLLTTNMPCTTGKSIHMDELFLVFKCPYTESIEGNSYSLSLQMDQRFFTTASYLSATLPASGMNAKLTFDSSMTAY